MLRSRRNRDIFLPQGCCLYGNHNTTGSQTCWMYHSYQLFKAELEVPEFLPRNTSRRVADLPHRWLILPSLQGSFQVSTRFRKEAAPGYALRYSRQDGCTARSAFILHKRISACFISLPMHPREFTHTFLINWPPNTQTSSSPGHFFSVAALHP